MTATATSMETPCERALRVVMAGGATGGHLFPAVAIAREFMARNAATRVLFVSIGNAFERATLRNLGFSLSTITAEGIKGRGILRQVRAAVKIPVGVAQAAGILFRFRPDLMVGVGSYAAGPVAMAAWLLRIPIVLHEQNRLPGITNRLLAGMAARIYVSFAVTTRHFPPGKVRWTGNPVRREILESDGGAAKNGTGRFTVLIMGGSQGARGINRAVMGALEHLKGTDRYFFMHQTGTGDREMVAQAYAEAGCDCQVAAFFDDMAARYRRADLVCCRAGATTFAEVTALGKCVLFVPFPHAADNHQVLNARMLSDAGAAVTLEEKDLTGRRLAEILEMFRSDPAQRERMAAAARQFGRPAAAAEIVTDCCRLVGTAGA